MRKDRGTDPMMVNGQLVYNATTARIRLGDIIEDAARKGLVSVIVSSKGRKVAVVPYKLLGRLNAGNFISTGAASDADTMAEDQPRNEVLPAEVTAHSQPAQARRTAFGLMAPSKDDANGR